MRPWSFARKKDISEKRLSRLFLTKSRSRCIAFSTNSSITQLCGGAILVSHKLRYYPHAVLIALDFAGEITERGHEGGHGHYRDVVNVIKDASLREQEIYRRKTYRRVANVSH
jgi:hypothetical protein